MGSDHYEEALLQQCLQSREIALARFTDNSRSSDLQIEGPELATPIGGVVAIVAERGKFRETNSHTTPNEKNQG